MSDYLPGDLQLSRDIVLGMLKSKPGYEMAMPKIINMIVKDKDLAASVLRDEVISKYIVKEQWDKLVATAVREPLGSNASDDGSTVNSLESSTAYAEDSIFVPVKDMLEMLLIEEVFLDWMKILQLQKMILSRKSMVDFIFTNYELVCYAQQVEGLYPQLSGAALPLRERSESNPKSQEGEDKLRNNDDIQDKRSSGGGCSIVKSGVAMSGRSRMSAGSFVNTDEKLSSSQMSELGDMMRNFNLEKVPGGFSYAESGAALAGEARIDPPNVQENAKK